MKYFVFILSLCTAALSAVVQNNNELSQKEEQRLLQLLKDQLGDNYKLKPGVEDSDVVRVIREFKKFRDLEPMKLPADIDEKAILNSSEDAKLTVPELIRKYGYPEETHFVTTKDGYILQMHRIPHGKTSTPSKKQSVFLMHGLLCSSSDWIITGPNKALAYILADQGYDVWMGNARGNHYSRNHTKLNPNHSQFWDFSWHEIGDIDQPAMLDYVLKQTGEKQTFVIAHSQGTTTFFVMAAQHPEYNAKVKAHIGLAPIGFMNHLTSPFMHLGSLFIVPMDYIMGLIGMNEVLPNTWLMEFVGDTLCADGELTQVLCTNLLFVVCGFSPKEMNATLLPTLMGHTPAGISKNQIVHYAQEINSGHFRQFDRGLVGNLLHYHTLFPPDYQLKKVTAPVHLLYSKNDWMSGVTDVMKLCKDISNCKTPYLVSDPQFNHLDYMFGINAKTVAYDQVLKILEEYQ